MGYMGVAEDCFTDADELWFGFWCAMGFRQCRVFMCFAENVHDWVLVDILILY